MQEPLNFKNTIQKCKTRDDLIKVSQAFCKHIGFRHFFALCSFFDNFTSPFTSTISNYCKTPKYRYDTHTHDMLSEMIEYSLRSSTPLIRGKLRIKKTDNLQLPDNIKHISPSDIHSSISFPVHFPSGKFALFHVGTHSHSEIDYKQAMIYGYQFALDISEHFLAIMDNPFPAIHLSDREKTCLVMACDGNSPRTISLKLGLSVYTVQHYLKNIRKKMHGRNLKQALSRAIASGQIRPLASAEN